MEQPRERIKDIIITVTEAEEEIIVVLEAEEEAEALEEIRAVRARLKLTSSATSAQTASTTANCSMTKWLCQASTALQVATAGIDGGPRRGAT